MKKTISVLLSLVLLLSVLVSVEASSVKKTQYTADAFEDATILKFFPSVEGTESIGYSAKDDWSSGPEAFMVEDGEICVLDSVNSRIIVAKNDLVEYVYLSECIYPVYFCKVNGTFYVIDYEGSFIRGYSSNYNSVEEIPFPDKICYQEIYQLSCIDDSIQLITDKLCVYRFDSKSRCWIKTGTIKADNDFGSIKSYTINGTTISIETGENTSSQLIKIDSDYLWTDVYEFVPYYPIIETEYTLRKFDLNGKLIGCTLLNLKEAFSIPQSPFYISNNNEAYAMVCLSDGVYITKPNIRPSYNSHMNELTQLAKTLTKVHTEAETKALSALTSKTRSEVNQRAINSYNKSWYIVHSGNTTAPSGATLPTYIVDANLNDHMNGIPYCWGHYFGSLSTFESQIANGYAAGNTAHTSVSNTTGLDCSGYASYLYLLGTHRSTKYFYNNGYWINGSSSNSKYSCSVSNLKYMDYMVKYSEGSSNNHVVVFFSRNAYTGKFSIYESTTNNSIEKTTYRNVSTSYLQNYYLKTPYLCGGTSSCNMEYHYNSTKHWRMCSLGCGETTSKVSHDMNYQHNNIYHWGTCLSNCGYETGMQPHNWVQSSSNYVCSVCGAVFNMRSPLHMADILNNKITTGGAS
ncbi:MAG: hypothetical protein IKQ36_08915 [Clostridia bacterium]|nr:hypothetical protein [Clostridia bacterium]